MKKKETLFAKDFNEKLAVSSVFEQIRLMGKSVNSNRIKFNYVKPNSINLSFDSGQKTFIFSARIMPRIKQNVMGMSARTEQGRYVLFFDYDSTLGLMQEEIKAELLYLQRKHELSDIYFFESSPGSYHAICCDTFSLVEAYEILRESSCDYAFIGAAKNYNCRTWILRIGRKGDKECPKPLTTLVSNFEGKRQQSYAHLKFLSKYYKNLFIDWDRIKSFDGCKKIPIVEYKTGSRLK